MTDEDNTDDALAPLHSQLIRWGPALMVFVGLVLVVAAISLDRDWLAPLGVVTLWFGVLLPRASGQFEATASGVKGQLNSTAELLKMVGAKGKDLPEAAVERAKASVLAAPPRRTQVRISPEALAQTQARMDELMEFTYQRMQSLPERRKLETLAEQALDAARREWRVVFKGTDLDDGARLAFDGADDVVLVSGHSSNAGHSHTVIVNAPSATEAVNRVKRLVDGHGHFGRWEAEALERPYGFFNSSENDEDESDDDDGPPSAESPAA